MYNDLAWTEPIISLPEEYAEETELFSKIVKEHSKNETGTLLHFGCDTGGNDYTFKKHFNVDRVDISEDMLEITRKLNPEITYFYGDMRTIRLLEHSYDRFILGGGKYHLYVFICTKAFMMLLLDYR